MRDAVSDFRSVFPGALNSERSPARRTPLPVLDVPDPARRGRAIDDVIDLADLVVLGDRIGAGASSFPRYTMPMPTWAFPISTSLSWWTNSFSSIACSYRPAVRSPGCSNRGTCRWVRVGRIEPGLRCQRGNGAQRSGDAEHDGLFHDEPRCPITCWEGILRPRRPSRRPAGPPSRHVT